MRILFANHKCGQWGGAEENLAQAAAGLAQRGHACYLAYGQRTGRGADEFEAIFQEALPCRELGGGPDSGFADLLAKWSPDLVYLHKCDYLPWRTKPGLRVVRMVHDHDLCCPRRHKYFSFGNNICRRPAGMACWADLAFIGRNEGRLVYQPIAPKLREMRRNRELDLLLAASRFMRDELLMNGFGHNKVRILPPVPRGEMKVPPPMGTDPLVLFVGQLIKGKGVDLLLRALRLIKTPFTCAIAGQGNAQGGLESLAAELGLSERVQFLGWRSRPQLDELYARARLVAVPSRWPEPFGMIGLEAMAFARPVVGFKVGGIPDWLVHEHNGLLADEADIQNLAGAIERLLSDPELAEGLGRNGFELRWQRYQFEHYLDDLEALLADEEPKHEWTT